MTEKYEGLKALRAPPLLMTESQQDYDEFVARLIEEIAPQNIYDEIKVRDIIEHSWHIRRLRWTRISIVNMSYRKAIVQLLVYELQAHDEHKAEILADQWFTSEKVKAELVALLARFNLTELAIEALAIKLNGTDLERLGRELKIWEVRRDKALDKLYKRRDNLHERARTATQRAIDGDGGSVHQTGTA